MMVAMRVEAVLRGVSYRLKVLPLYVRALCRVAEPSHENRQGSQIIAENDLDYAGFFAALTVWGFSKRTG